MIPDTTLRWNHYQRLTFCIGFVYVFLYIFPFPFSFIGAFPEVGNLYKELFWDSLIPWTGTHVFGISEPISTVQGGSGDTTYHWVQIFLVLILSLLLGFTWFLIAGKRTNYERFRHWINVYMTYFLIGSMIVYGMVKVIKLQFPDPGLTRLLQTYGDSSPMGIAWTFMGASSSYTFFAGLSEILAALLLLLRRTRTLGGLFAFGVTLNIFLMNMSYDIPVKLYSFHLMVFAIAIAAQDMRRLLYVFILNKPTVPFQRSMHFKDRKWNKGVMVVKFVLVTAFLVNSTVEALESRTLYGSKMPLPEHYGIYDVKSFIRNGEEIPPLLTETTRWRKLLIEKGNYGIVKHMDHNRSIYHSYEVDTLDESFVLKSFSDTTKVYLFDYTKTEEGLHLLGTVGPDTLEMELIRKDLSEFELTNRGFHWINEYPHNR